MADWKGRTALIVSGAPQQDISYVMNIYERLEMPLVVCADRGVDYALELGLQPDLFVADRDSTKAEYALPPKCENVMLLPEKDDTDTMHALNIVIDRGCKNVVLVCATGGRIDHMMANLSLCEYCSERNVICTIFDERNCIQFHEKGIVKLTIDAMLPYFSIIPLDEELKAVSITGAKYSLQNCTVKRSDILTISNEFSEEEVRISVENGKWLLIRSCD